MFFVANWKMNMDLQQGKSFLKRFCEQISDKEKDRFIFLPPANLSHLFFKSSFYWGSQNCFYQNKGAFSGENSPLVFKQLGASFCLIGHSERRYLFGETDLEIQKKFDNAQKVGLIPILCIGETHENINNKDIFFKQQLSWLKTFIKYKQLPFNTQDRPFSFKKTPFILAYEPLWAIGSGNTPSPKTVNDFFLYVKETLEFEHLLTFYGGSISNTNIRDFSCQKHIDGFLIGTASLDPDKFYFAYQNAVKK